MSEETQGSISACFERLASRDDQALNALWDRYFHQLLAVARSKLSSKMKRSFDEEDIVVSAFECLRKGAQAGRFAELRDRTELWKLLVVITQQKAIDRIRRENAFKRIGGTQTADQPSGTRNAIQILSQLIRSVPTPEDQVAFEERTQQLLSELRDDVLRRIAVLRLEGYTNLEIAQQLGIASRSVERKLRFIRETWKHLLNSEE